MTDSKSNNSSNMIGQQVGNYVIESLLGVGGMGQVFKARHVLLDRPAALKLMHANLAKDPAFQARFLQEARSAAALRHPHIVEVFDFEDQKDGFAYLVMELITGGSLRNLLQDAGRGSVDWSLERGLDLVRQSTDALAYAHALKMVHRDIKPDNLLLQNMPNGGPPILKVGDFGLARLGEGSGLTAANTAMGTPAYMSPEQCQGQDLDGRSDIYALGVVLYEVATGTLPFSIKTVSEAVFKHVYTTPTSPRQLRPDLPEALDALIMRCLAKLPGDRYANASDLSAALRELTSSISPNSSAASMLYSVPMISTQGGGQGTAIGQGGAEAPDVGTLPGAASLPRIQVLDEAGTLLQVIGVQSSGLSVGRMPNNDLQLDAQNVSRNHLRIALENGRVMVTDLGSRSGTQLGDVMLPAQIASEWPFGGMLRVGSYWLRLDPPSTGSQPVNINRGTPVPQSQPGLQSAGMRSFVSSGQITVGVAEELLTLIPGQSSSVEVTLTNSSQSTDQLVVSVDGVPEEWVTLPPPVQVTANGQSVVRLSITVPEDSSARTGEYPVEVRARSRSNHAEGGVMMVRWNIVPFLKSSMSIAPARLNARKSGQYRVTLRNEGNAPVSYRLAAADEEGTLSLSFNDDQVTVEPGEHKVVLLRAETNLMPLGSPENLSVEVKAISHDGNQNQVSTTVFVHEPVLPVWLGGIAGIALLATIGWGMASGFFTGARNRPTPTLLPSATVLVQPAAGAETAAVQTTTALANIPPEATVDQQLPPTAAPVAAGETPVVQPTQPGGTTPGGTTPGGTTPGGTAPGGTEPGGTAPGGTAPGGTAPGGADGVAPEAQTATVQAQQALETATAQAVQQASTATAIIDQRATMVAATQTAAANAGIAQQTAIAGTQTAEVLNIQQTQQVQQQNLTATVAAQQAQATGTAAAQQTALVVAQQTAQAQVTGTAVAQQTAIALQGQQTATAQAQATATAAAQQAATAVAQQTATAVAQITVPPTQLSPPDGQVFGQFPRTVTLVWDALPNAVNYTVEVQYCSPSGCAVSANPLRLVTLAATTYTFDFVGAQPGRWRVLATGTSGVPGPQSLWRNFRFTQ